MNKSKKAFTLIELVVVMAIIAVLALLIVAAITAARRQSINTQRTGNVKTFEVALESRYSKCGAYVGDPKALGTSCGSVAATDTTPTLLQTHLVTEGYLTAGQMNLDSDAGYSVTLATSTFTLIAKDFPANAVNIYTATR